MVRDFWQEDAACRGMDPNVFYPEAHNGNDSVYLGKVREAKAICATCPVREQCLALAVENHEQLGIWGGKTLKERRKIARDGSPGASPQS